MLTAICAVAILTAKDDPKAWGLETVAQIRRDYKRPARGLYADSVENGKPSGPSFNWGVGVMIPALNAAAKADPAWKKELREYVDATRVYWNDKGPVPGYDVLPGPKDVDRYYDDNEWMVMALCDASDILKDRQVLLWAQQTLDYVLSGEDDKLGGGVYWHEPKKDSKNACSNGPAAAACLAVYARTKNARYLQKAKEIYAWNKAHLQDPEDGLFWDNVKLDGRVDKTKFSYNTALMIRSAAELARFTGDKPYATEAERMAQASEKRWIDPATGGIKDGGRFAHLLLESWTYVPTPTRKAEIRRAVAWTHDHARDDQGRYGGRFDAPPRPEPDEVRADRPGVGGAGLPDGPVDRPVRVRALRIGTILAGGSFRMKTLFASLVVLAVAGSASANLVTNGGFEADAYNMGGYNVPATVTGWTQIGQVAGIGKGYLSSPSQEIDLSGVTDDASGTGLYQDLMTVAGQKYSLSLNVYTGGNLGHSGGVDVKIGDAALATNLQGYDRTAQTLSFTATGATTRLTLASNHGNVSHVDNVNVQAVPEPASMAALGLGALGLLKRRRK